MSSAAARLVAAVMALFQVFCPAELRGELAAMGRGAGVGGLRLREYGDALLGQLAEPGLIGRDRRVEVVKLALQAGKPRGGVTQSGRLGLEHARVGRCRGGHGGQRLRIRGRRIQRSAPLCPRRP